MVPGTDPTAAAPLGKSKTIQSLAITQVVLSVCVFIVGIAATVVESRYTTDFGTGIWTGAFLIVAGAFGIAAAKRPWNKCLMVSYLVLAIIGTVVSAVLLIMTSIMIAIFDGYSYWRPRHAEIGLNATLLILSIAMSTSTVSVSYRSASSNGSHISSRSGAVHRLGQHGVRSLGVLLQHLGRPHHDHLQSHITRGHDSGPGEYRLFPGESARSLIRCRPTCPFRSRVCNRDRST
jgi:CD20-like family